MTQGPELTSEQLAVVGAGAGEKQLVLASAGTGKTHTLVRRLEYLVEEEGLSPGSEILVLSFSRAAVEELRRRLSDRSGAAAFVGAYTFDSFATRLLAQDSPDDGWMSGGYDGRIRAASELLSEEELDSPQLSELRHVLIDEVQDLVGVRAELVLALVSRLICGLTLAGDPAQRIYGFQSDGDESSHGSFLETLRTRLGDSLVTRRLSDNFRAQSRAAKSVLELGPVMEQECVDFDATSRALDDVMLGLQPLSSLHLLKRLVERSKGEIALLARTNGDVLLLCREMSELGIPYRYQSRAEYRPTPGWIATCLRGLTLLNPGRSLMLDRLAPLAVQMGAQPDDLWGALLSLGRGRNRSLDVQLLGRRIRAGAVPESIPTSVRRALRLSTIHRAKGLEFDHVVLVEPSTRDRLRKPNPEELRVTYVGLTRARDHLLVTRAPESRGMRVLREAGGRWARTGFGPHRSRLYALEVLPRDVDRQCLAGATIPLDSAPTDIQDYLASSVSPGDEVDLKLLRATTSGPELAYYGVMHESRGIGVTSEGFAMELRRALRPRGRCRWPVRIGKVFVEDVETFAGLASSGEEAGLGTSGTWLGVRLFGLGELAFKKEGEA